MAVRVAWLLPLVLFAAPLAGCAALRDGAVDEPYITRGAVVIVYPRWSGADPLPTAERVCAARNAYAIPRTLSITHSSFTCQPLDAGAGPTGLLLPSAGSLSSGRGR